MTNEAKKEMGESLKMALNAALSNHQLAQARMRALNPGGLPLDSKRSQVWCEYGWKENLSFEDFFAAYARTGVGHGAVKKLVQRCWRSMPWIIEGEERDNATKETPWETRFKRLMKPSMMWRAWRRADEMRLVGGHAGLLLHFRDDLPWDEPAKPGRGVEKLSSAWASSLKPIDIITDSSHPRFGMPEFWQYTYKGVAGASNQQKIHWTRIFIVGDWEGKDTPFLAPVFNNLVNMEKVEGGSGESFLKNASRQLNFNFAPEVNLKQIADAYGVPLAELQSVFDNVTRSLNHGVDATVITQGASVAPLTTSVPDPQPTYDINLRSISAGLDIAAKILVGNQTGERASTEDNRYFDERCQSRREGDLTPELEEWVEFLVARKLINLPSKGITVMWDDLTESSVAEKLASAKVMSDMNATSPGEDYFTTEEVREAAGYEAQQAPLGEDCLDDEGEGDADDGSPQE